MEQIIWVFESGWFEQIAAKSDKQEILTTLDKKQ